MMNLITGEERPTMREMALSLAASFFFAVTFILNRSMELAGGSWTWSSSLRFFFMVPLLFVCHSSCPPQSRSGLARHEAPSMDMDRLGDGRFRLFRRPSLRIGWRESGENEHLYRCNEEV